MFKVHWLLQPSTTEQRQKYKQSNTADGGSIFIKFSYLHFIVNLHVRWDIVFYFWLFVNISMEASCAILTITTNFLLSINIILVILIYIYQLTSFSEQKIPIYELLIKCN